MKLHLLLDHEGHLLAYAVVTPGKQHEIRVARCLKLPPGSRLAFGRGYTDYDWFAALSRQKVFFVTWLKEQADFLVVQRHAVTDSERKAGVRRDEMIVFRQQATADNDRFVRRVVYWDEENAREFVLLTDHFDLAPSQVAAIYKQRWQVELFFKALKQNLRGKTFVGTSANAWKDPGLDSTDLDSAHQVPAVAPAAGREPVPVGGAVAAAVVCLPRLVALDRSPV